MCCNISLPNASVKVSTVYIISFLFLSFLFIPSFFFVLFFLVPCLIAIVHLINHDSLKCESWHRTGKLGWGRSLLVGREKQKWGKREECTPQIGNCMKKIQRLYYAVVVWVGFKGFPTPTSTKIFLYYYIIILN